MTHPGADQDVYVVNDPASADEKVFVINNEVANLAPNEGDLLVYENGEWTTKTVAGAGAQPNDTDLTAIAALATTAFGRALLELADAGAGRTALGLGTAATHATGDYDAAGAAAAAQAASQPVDADLTAIAALATTAFGRGLLTQADAGATRTTLGLGTAATHATGDYDAAGAAAAAQAASQPLDSDLTALAALTTTAYGRSLLEAADAGAERTLLGLGTAATHATGDFAQTANNLSDVTAATARTNLGLGNAATKTVDAASGVMGLDASGNGSSPPAAHALVGSKRHTDSRRPSAVISENYPRTQGASNQSGLLSSGQIFFQAIALEAGMVLTKLGAFIGTTALARGSNGDSHASLLLIDPALALVAATADDTSSTVSTNAWYEKVIATIASGASATYTVATTGMHWIGLLMNIGTGGSPAIATLGGLTVGSANFLNLDAPTLCFADTAATYTTPPAFPFTATKSAFKAVVNHVRATGS